jgi:hypothetical protein
VAWHDATVGHARRALFIFDARLGNIIDQIVVLELAGCGGGCHGKAPEVDMNGFVIAAKGLSLRAKGLALRAKGLALRAEKGCHAGLDPASMRSWAHWIAGRARNDNERRQ